jgi:hypothetical protein
MPGLTPDGGSLRSARTGNELPACARVPTSATTAGKLWSPTSAGASVKDGHLHLDSQPALFAVELEDDLPRGHALGRVDLSRGDRPAERRFQDGQAQVAAHQLEPSLGGHVLAFARVARCAGSIDLLPRDCGRRFQVAREGRPRVLPKRPSFRHRGLGVAHGELEGFWIEAGQHLAPLYLVAEVYLHRLDGAVYLEAQLRLVDGRDDARDHAILACDRT